MAFLFRRILRLSQPCRQYSLSMSTQVTNRVIMIEPGCFCSNPDTVGDNAFQRSQEQAPVSEVQKAALVEFQDFVKVLKAEGINVDVVRDTTNLPDAIFPNNWVSFHSPLTTGTSAEGGGGTPVISLYPMLSPSRRNERRNDIIKSWTQKLGAVVRDYTQYESKGKFLEGTGSLVLDRVASITYACLSQRTHPDLLDIFCKDFGYKLVTFRAFSKLDNSAPTPIYHTNVMMSLCERFAIICFEAIMDEKERNNVRESIEKSGKEIIPISLQQVSAFAGNVLQLRSTRGHDVLAMSTRAYKSLSEEQLEAFDRNSCTVVHSGLETIETYGGGGARCMIAEVFPPLDQQ